MRNILTRALLLAGLALPATAMAQSAPLPPDRTGELTATESRAIGERLWQCYTTDIYHLDHDRMTLRFLVVVYRGRISSMDVVPEDKAGANVAFAMHAAAAMARCDKIPVPSRFGDTSVTLAIRFPRNQ